MYVMYVRSIDHGYTDRRTTCTYCLYAHTRWTFVHTYLLRTYCIRDVRRILWYPYRQSVRMTYVRTQEQNGTARARSGEWWLQLVALWHYGTCACIFLLGIIHSPHAYEVFFDNLICCYCLPFYHKLASNSMYIFFIILNLYVNYKWTM